MTQTGFKWAETVRLEHEQSNRVRTDDPQVDYWRGLAHRFAPASRDDAYGDDTVKALLTMIRQTDTVLDVGAGAGRLAVPIAEHCAHVTAVEPSPAMAERMAGQAEAWGVSNLSIVEARWEDADVEPADVVVCSHVLYTVQDIEGFIQKLDRHARREVAVVLFEETAMSNYFEFWPAVHGEERVKLPSLPELKSLLTEMGIVFTATPLQEWESRPFKDRQTGVEETMARLFVGPDSEKAPVVEHAVESAVVAVDGGFRFRWARPHRPWLVRWDTSPP